MTIETWLNLIGTFFFALSGSLVAAGRNFDVVGSLLLGSLTGLGGGVIRDLILRVTPIAFAQPVFLTAPLAAAVVVFFLSHSVQRFPRTLLLFDAAGLGLFCTTGTAVALASNLNPSSAILLGTITGVGGGVLRDVVANRDPLLFNPRDLYLVPALGGATLTAGVWMMGWYSLPSALAMAALVFVLRALSLRFRWEVPSAVKGQRKAALIQRYESAESKKITGRS